MENNYNRHEARMDRIRRERNYRAHLLNTLFAIVFVYIIMVVFLVRNAQMHQKATGMRPVQQLTGQVVPLQGTAPVLQPADSVQPQQATGGVASYN